MKLDLKLCPLKPERYCVHVGFNGGFENTGSVILFSVEILIIEMNFRLFTELYVQNKAPRFF
jgi:hypothetical protein